MLVDWVRAYNAHDAKALAAIYAKDADLSHKMKLLKGREAIQRLWQERFDKNPNIKTKQTSLEVRFLSPTLALETGYWEDDGVDDPERLKTGKVGMWTCVHQKIGGKWLIISDRGWPKQQSEENLLKVDGNDSVVKAELEIEKEVSQFINNSKAYTVKKQNVGNNSNKTELLLTRAISLNPSNPRLFSARAKLYADQNRPKLAARDYFSFSELDLESDVESHEATIAWMDGAAAQVLAEDLSSYQSYCLNMLRRFEGTEDTIVAERVAKSVLFQKIGKKALPMAKKMADLAMKNDWPHARFVQGLANYRAGNFKAASNYAEECLSLPKGNVFLDIQANLLLAMASNAQGDSAKYKASLSKAKGHMENIKYYWFHNKVICQSLLFQAEKQ
jgi:uncharacterized protein (TIGR02246 family)